MNKTLPFYSIPPFIIRNGIFSFQFCVASDFRGIGRTHHCTKFKFNSWCSNYNAVLRPLVLLWVAIGQLLSVSLTFRCWRKWGIFWLAAACKSHWTLQVEEGWIANNGRIESFVEFLPDYKPTATHMSNILQLYFTSYHIYIFSSLSFSSVQSLNCIKIKYHQLWLVEICQTRNYIFPFFSYCYF